MDETIPTLSSGHAGNDHIYMRFSNRRKRAILALVSAFAFMHHTISQIIRLYTTAVASDLKTTPSVIGISLGLWLFVACFGGLTGGAYSTYFGRRPVYLVGSCFMCVGSIGAGLSTSLSMYMISRAMEAFGASSGVYVGSAVVGDIYQLDQRGNGLGILRAVTYTGVILTLPIGGLIIEYASWRTLQFCLGGMAGFIFTLMFLYFPETSHPGMRGIDQISSDRPSKSMVVNPLKPMVLLCSLNILAISFATYTAFLASSSLSVQYCVYLWFPKVFLLVVMVPLGLILDSQFGIANPTIVSGGFVLMAIGNMLGAYLSGKMSDRAVVLQNGSWIPEDRLRIALPATLVGVPGVLLAFGLAAEYLPRSSFGLSLCFICLFVNGVVTEFVLCPSIAYLIDLMHDRSAEAVAATTSLALILLSVSDACTIPFIEKLGIVWTNALAAVLTWGAHIALSYTVKHHIW